MTPYQEQARPIAPNVRRDLLGAALMEVVEVEGKRTAEFLGTFGDHLKLEGIREPLQADLFILTVTRQSGQVERWAWGGKKEARFIGVHINGRGENPDKASELKGDGLIRQLKRENRIGNTT